MQPANLYVCGGTATNGTMFDCGKLQTKICRNLACHEPCPSLTSKRHTQNHCGYNSIGALRDSGRLRWATYNHLDNGCATSALCAVQQDAGRCVGGFAGKPCNDRVAGQGLEEGVSIGAALSCHIDFRRCYRSLIRAQSRSAGQR
jgi:hypothetical protein